MLVNATTKKIIVKDTLLCVSSFSKSKGLMFSTKNAVRDRALIFLFNKAVKYSIHMWFVFYPIDILFLDKNKEIIELKRDLKPFRLYFPDNSYYYVVELERETISKNGLKKGDLLDF